MSKNRIGQHLECTTVNGDATVTFYYVSFVLLQVGFCGLTTDIRLIQTIIIEEGRDPISPDKMWEEAIKKIPQEWNNQFPTEPFIESHWSISLRVAKVQIHQPRHRG